MSILPISLQLKIIKLERGDENPLVKKKIIFFFVFFFSTFQNKKTFIII